MGNWLFKKINLSLRTEVIVNISFVILEAILLIGFTVSKVNECNMVEEKITIIINGKNEAILSERRGGILEKDRLKKGMQ